MTDEFDRNQTTKDPVLQRKFTILHAYEKLRVKKVLSSAKIRGHALSTGQMEHFLLNPNRIEPEHVKRSVRDVERKFYRQVSSLINNWPDTRGDRKRK